jgi:uncharacterized coiled-coil protein SlyX
MEVMEINLEAVLGTLAAYFAMMAVLAVGTEVVLDILKLKNLKKPVSPSQALTSLKDWVPPEKWDDIEQRAKHMEQVIQEVDTTLTQTRYGLARLRSQAEPILAKYGHLTPENIANVMRELEARYQSLSDTRLAWIRLLSLVLGIAWAVVLQINSLDLLGPVVPDAIANLLGGYDTLWYSVAGLVLSGLGAAAGSSFWYEQMARLRQARQVVDTTEQLKEQAAAIASGIASAGISAKE